MIDQDTFIHLLAGGVGGTAGAILTCPLEVVKTRLQSSNSGFDTTLKAAEPAHTHATGTTTCRTLPHKKFSTRPESGLYRPRFALTAWVGGGHAAQVQACRPVNSQLSGHPPEPAPGGVRPVGRYRGLHTTTASTPVRTTMGVWACLRHIWVHEGPRGLFRGLGPNLVGVAPSRAIYFWSYSTTKKGLNRRLPKPNRDTPFVHVVSAASAGFVSSCLTNPIWLVKTRLQLDRSRAGGVASVIKNIYSEQGIRGFWKGVTASWWGISETIIHFVIYEFLKKSLAEYQQKKKGSDKTMMDFAGFMLCGATSKTCATCVAYPHEVARTRMRESGRKYRSFWQTLKLVNKEEGRRGLYRGLGTQLIRQIPNTAIMMATYELTVYMLTKYIKTKPQVHDSNLDAISQKNSHSQ